jgi:ribose 5-phosphate isomerase B
MHIAVAADHAGFPLKAMILEVVREMGHVPVDLGTDSEASVDYPDFAAKLAREIIHGRAKRGILLCGSGVGACIAANKFKGIYASVCHDTYSAAQGVNHDDMNVLCLGPRIIGPELAKELVKSFLTASFSSDERHLRRVGKIRAIENEHTKDA